MTTWTSTTAGARCGHSPPLPASSGYNTTSGTLNSTGHRSCRRSGRRQLMNAKKIKKIAGTTTLVGALGAAALGLGTGSAQAKPNVPVPPVVPGNIAPNPFFIPPGQFMHAAVIPGSITPANPTGISNPFFRVAPGQVKKIPLIPGSITPTNPTGISNPLFGVPPGHWDIGSLVSALQPPEPQPTG
jgi:hypothetical protein